MSDRIFEIEHHPDGVILLRFKSPTLTGLLAEPTKRHVVAAQREIMLALRSMLDTAIEGAEQVERKATNKKKTKIDVQ
jgi:hypothetical protein